MTIQQQQTFEELVYKLINENRQDIKDYEYAVMDDCSEPIEYIYFIRKNPYHIGKEPTVLITCKVHSTTKPTIQTNTQIAYCSLNVRYISKEPRRDAFYAQTNTKFVKDVFYNMQQLSENIGR